MSTFKLPRQSGLTLDDIKAATVAYARKHGYVEEASITEVKGLVRGFRAAKVAPSPATKKVSTSIAKGKVVKRSVA